IPLPFLRHNGRHQGRTRRAPQCSDQIAARDGDKKSNSALRSISKSLPVPCKGVVTGDQRFCQRRFFYGKDIQNLFWVVDNH
ncbi:MAG: hypothetical protein WAV08_14985, partial [Desulfobacterales bacterium]